MGGLDHPERMGVLEEEGILVSIGASGGIMPDETRQRRECQNI